MDNNAKELRKEFNSSAFRKSMVKHLPKHCVSCGCKEGLAYHHIVPLILGGQNNLGNIVPLCYCCHKKAHGARKLIKSYDNVKLGRKRRVLPENYKDILWSYINAEIGKKECQEALGIKSSCKLNDEKFYKEFLQENNIKVHRNNVDLLRNKRKGSPIGIGEQIGYIEIYGKKRQYIYKEA